MVLGDGEHDRLSEKILSELFGYWIIEAIIQECLAYSDIRLFIEDFMLIVSFAIHPEDCAALPSPCKPRTLRLRAVEW